MNNQQTKPDTDELTGPTAHGSFHKALKSASGQAPLCQTPPINRPLGKGDQPQRVLHEIEDHKPSRSKHNHL